MSIITRISEHLLIPSLPAQQKGGTLPPRLWPAIALMAQIAMLDDPSHIPAAHLPLEFIIITCAREVGASEKEVGELSEQIGHGLDELELSTREFQASSGKTLKCIVPYKYLSKYPAYAFLLKTGHRAYTLPLRHKFEFNLLPQAFRDLGVEAVRGLNRIRYYSDPDSKILAPSAQPIYDARLTLEAIFKMISDSKFKVRSLDELARDEKTARSLFEREYEKWISKPSATELYKSESEREDNSENHVERRLRSLQYLTGLKSPNPRRASRPSLADLMDDDDEDQYGVRPEKPKAQDVKTSSQTGDAPDEDLPVYTTAPPGNISGPGGGLGYLVHHRNQEILFSRDLSVSCAKDVLSIQDLAANFQHWFAEPWSEQSAIRKLSVFRCAASLLTGIHPKVIGSLVVGDQKNRTGLLKRLGAYFDLNLERIVFLLPVDRTLDVMLEAGGKRLPPRGGSFGVASPSASHV